MPRSHRADIGGLAYHVLNRANSRTKIFRVDQDYAAFEKVLRQGSKRVGMRILAYCLMPNHWHLVLLPRKNGDLSKFMAWISMTHAARWHKSRGDVGTGHLYQGRYKSSIIQADRHFLAVARYVEGNARRADLVKQAEKWRWGSLWRRINEEPMQGVYEDWPVHRPRDWAKVVNSLHTTKDLKEMRESILKGRPCGEKAWQIETAKRYGLLASIHPRGRPRNNP